MKTTDRKQALVKIAYRLFVTQGYENTSVDDIIAEAAIAKGTYYYHFDSKEAILEDVVDLIIAQSVARAHEVIASHLPLEQKLVATIIALRPSFEEQPVKDAIHIPTNVILHEKVNQRILAEAVPIISQVVREAKLQGIFHCDDHIEERVRMVLILSSELFDHTQVTAASIAVFIETIEKIFGARPGTLSFITQLIGEKS